MRYFIIMLFLGITLTVNSQESITFRVERLSKPKELLPEIGSSSVLETLIEDRVNIGKYESGFPLNILAYSDLPKSLVNYGHHSFFDGMFSAYADHRPFVISPDMIWLLISQGFSHHVNFNSEKLRDKIVLHEGEELLTVLVEESFDECDWESIIDEFSEQISGKTKGDMSDILECNFSTTTKIEKIASQITIMNTAAKYFEYVVIYQGCGIPKITLEGSTEDWEKLLKKTEFLSQYDLEWWTKELIPIIEKIIETTNGRIDKDFWRNMFKYHTLKTYGNPELIDGWIVKFFPYDKDGERNELKELYGSHNLPDEIVKVPVLAVDSRTNTSRNIELWAGFIGLEQDEETFTLRPKIGWLLHEIVLPEEVVKRKSVDRLIVEAECDTISKGVLIYDYIKHLYIRGYTKTLPEEVNDIKIDTISLDRRSFFNSNLLPRLKKLLPNTHINSY